MGSIGPKSKSPNTLGRAAICALRARPSRRSGRDPRRMGAQGGTTDITGFFRLGSFCHSAILPLPKTRQVVASKTNLENAVISGVVCVAARKGRLHPRSRVPSSHQTASLKSLLLSQLGCSAKNDAADGGLSARAAAALHLLCFRRMALFCRYCPGVGLKRS